MFGNHKSSLNFESDNGGESDSDPSFPFVFTGNMTIMATSDLEPKDVRDVGSNNTTDDHIASIWKQLIFSSDDREDVVLKVCYLAERANIAASNAFSTSSF